MKMRRKKNAFTLVELLLAVTMITAILSMVYGTYLAALQSTEKYRTKMKACDNGMKVLEQLARQIRGCFIPRHENNKNDAHSTAGSLFISEDYAESSDSNNYFYGGSEYGNQEILHMVTANVSPSIQGEPVPLYEITYRFEAYSGRLLLNKRKFYGRSEHDFAKKTWQEFAENLDSVTLSFFNGEKWVRAWSFSKKKSLPRAVKIEITVTGHDGRRYCYQTAAAPESQKTYRDTND